MQTRTTSILLALGALSLAGLAAAPALAAGPAAKYAGAAPSSVAGCPDIAWRLAKSADGSLRGIVWYDDMSGLSQASGMSENGHFHVTLTSVMGQGPVGTVDGERAADGGGSAKLVGQGCANVNMKMQPIDSWGGTG